MNILTYIRPERRTSYGHQQHSTSPHLQQQQYGVQTHSDNTRNFSDTTPLYPTTTSSSLPPPPYNSCPSTSLSIPPSIPTPSTTTIIHHPATATVLTLSAPTATVHLVPYNARAAIYWDVVETGGWFAFRNRSNGLFLCVGGRWDGGGLVCAGRDVPVGKEGEGGRFVVTGVGGEGGGRGTHGDREGGGRYVLQMLDGWMLRPVVVVKGREGEARRVARIGGKVGEEAVWVFERVN